MFKLKFMHTKYTLTVICIFFLITRLYKITEVPPSVYWDEASIGYNAYSISQTGKDEWGEFLPIHLRAFGEFKLPVYVYSVAIVAKIFGLSELSIRLPAVLYSLGVIILTFLLARKLTNNDLVGLWSSFLISISPWFFIFSRTGYEVTAGLMFYMLAIYFFLKLNENIWYILLSTSCFILSAYSYNSFRVIDPLTILILIIYHLGNSKSILKNGILPVLLSIIFLIISMIPIYRLYRYDAGASRLQTVGATSSSFIKNYLSHFSLDFLIVHGDKNLRSQQVGFGQLYFFEVIFLLLGIIYICRKPKDFTLLILLILISPIPAAITKESPHALRAIAIAPFISVVSALGLLHVKKYIRKKYLVEVAVVIVYLALFSNYFIKFIDIYPAQSSKDWQFGYKTIFTNFKSQFPNYNQVVISNHYGQPYIFGLYYLRYDPNKFKLEAIRNSVDEWGFSTVKSFNNFIFDRVRLTTLPKGKSLIFAAPEEELTSISNKGMILNLDNSIAFYIYEYEK